MSLVTISKQHKEAPPLHSKLREALHFIIFDKFFLVGAIAGLFGSLVLGLYVWLLRSGLLPLTPHYHPLRDLHALMQFYLFLTPFILGFFIQSAPKLFETRTRMPNAVAISLPVLVLAAAALTLVNDSWIARVLISISCGIVAAALVAQFLAASPAIRFRLGYLSIIGMISLACGVYADLSLQTNAVTLFWFGIVSIILATGQQFIAGVLGGRRATDRQNLRILVLYLAAGTAIFFHWYSAAAILGTLTFLSFIHATNATSAFRRASEPLAVAFVFAHVWAILGSLLLWHGAGATDAALHAWGIGYAVTLIIAVSLRLVGWITHSDEARPSLVIALLTIWQVVPFVRSFQQLYPFPPAAVWAASLAAGVVLLSWAGMLASRMLPMMLRRLGLLRRPEARRV